MAIVFPTMLPNRARNIRGAAQALIAAYVSGGADAASGAYAYLGQNDDGIEEEGGPEWGVIEGGEEYPAPIDAYLESDTYVARMVLREIPIEMLGILHGGSATIAGGAITGVTNVATTTPGNDPKGLALGGAYGDYGDVGGVEFCPTYYQVVIRHPNETGGTPAAACPGFYGYTQLWRCLIKPAGARKYIRKGIVTQAIEIQAFWDDSVTIRVTSGSPMLVAGGLGKYVANYS